MRGCLSMLPLAHTLLSFSSQIPSPTSSSPSRMRPPPSPSYRSTSELRPQLPFLLRAPPDGNPAEVARGVSNGETKSQRPAMAQVGHETIAASTIAINRKGPNSAGVRRGRPSSPSSSRSPSTSCPTIPPSSLPGRAVACYGRHQSFSISLRSNTRAQLILPAEACIFSSPHKGGYFVWKHQLYHRRRQGIK